MIKTFHPKTKLLSTLPRLCTCVRVSNSAIVFHRILFFKKRKFFFDVILVRKTHKGVTGKQCDPDQTPQNAAYDQGLQFTLNTGISIKHTTCNNYKRFISKKNPPPPPPPPHTHTHTYSTRHIVILLGDTLSRLFYIYTEYQTRNVSIWHRCPRPGPSSPTRGHFAKNEVKKKGP